MPALPGVLLQLWLANYGSRLGGRGGGCRRPWWLQDWHSNQRELWVTGFDAQLDFFSSRDFKPWRKIHCHGKLFARLLLLDLRPHSLGVHLRFRERDRVGAVIAHVNGVLKCVSQR